MTIAMTEPRIVVVGSSNTDLIVQSDRLPMPGETVLGGDLITTHGGKGANQAVAAARLGARVAFIARIGEDAHGQSAVENLQDEGLDLHYLVRDQDAPSGVALIVVGPGGENLIAVASGANGRLSPEDIAAATTGIEQSEIMLLQLEIPMETVFAATQAGRQAGAKVILNPAPAPSSGLDESLLAVVDILTPNQTEAAILTGEEDAEAGAVALLRQGVEIVVITLGEGGALLTTREGGVKRIPAFQVPIVDATAAGDAFNAGLAVALARKESIEQAVRFANAVAAISVTRLGAQLSLPRLEEVTNFLNKQ
jgi:ribokinase